MRRRELGKKCLTTKTASWFPSYGHALGSVFLSTGRSGFLPFELAPRRDDEKEPIHLFQLAALLRHSMASFATFPYCRGFQRRFLWLFLLTLSVTALAKGAAFLPGYSLDDYRPYVQEVPTLSYLVMDKGEKGRFGSAILNWGLHLLQVSPEHAKVFFVFCSIVVSALLAALVVRYWNLDRFRWLAALMACIIANHPFTAEIFTFRMALGISVFPLVILSLLLIPRRWSPRLVAVGSVLFAVALSIYQVALPYCLMIVAVGAAIWLTRYLVLGGASGWPQRVISLLSMRRLVRHRNTALLGCAVFGTALYIALTISLALALQVSPAERTQLLPVHQLDERVQVVFEELKYRLVEPGPLVSRLTQGLLLLILLSALAGLLWRTRSWFRPRPPLLVLAIFALLLASLVWSFGPLLLLAEFWPSPRVMGHVGIFWAGALAVSYLCFGPRVRAALALLAVLTVLSFIGSNNRVFNDQFRLNVRDAHKANRIVARLETLPGFWGIKKVAINGVNWSYPNRFQTLDHDMNVSAFGADWSKVALLAEISGYNLTVAEEEEDLAMAAAFCRGVEYWPAPQSVTIQGGLAIVCLGPG